MQHLWMELDGVQVLLLPLSCCHRTVWGVSYNTETDVYKRQLKASLNPPIVITKIAKTRIRTSISVIKIRFLDGLKLSRTNKMCIRDRDISNC